MSDFSYRSSRNQSLYEQVALEYATTPPHQPFKSLESLVSEESPIYDIPLHPISNDELAVQFSVSYDRVESPDFQNTSKHNVALVIGESALIAALPYIPEETILVADSSLGMLRYMSLYRDTLRSSTTSAEWRQIMTNELQQYCDALETSGQGSMRRFNQLWDRQVADWEGADMTHPFTNASHFARSRQAAEQKAIIPYNVDIINKDQVGDLAKILNLGNAAITFLNYSNVLGYNRQRMSGADMIGILNRLPLTPETTILASSPRAKLTETNQKQGLIALGALGPFVGTAEMLAASQADPWIFDLQT